jgi:hypothetical protein
MDSNRINDLQQVASKSGLPEGDREEEFSLISERISSTCRKRRKSRAKVFSTPAEVRETRRNKAAQARYNQSWKTVFGAEWRRVHEQVARELEELEKCLLTKLP